MGSDLTKYDLRTAGRLPADPHGPIQFYRCSDVDPLLAAKSAEVERLRAALEDAIQTWTFSDGQFHTHSWHDREDWFARHPVALEIRRRQGVDHA